MPIKYAYFAISISINLKPMTDCDKEIATMFKSSVQRNTLCARKSAQVEWPKTGVDDKYFNKNCNLLL